jgi:hypothetical protein
LPPERHDANDKGKNEPARMHFWLFAARFNFAKSAFGSIVPKKMGLNFRAMSAVAQAKDANLIHARVGEQQRRIVVRDGRR